MTGPQPADNAGTENDNDISAPKSTENCVVIDELLTSAWHAIVHGKTNEQITQQLSLFYDDDAITKARQKLSPFYTFAKRSDRVTKKERTTPNKAIDIFEIVRAMRETDWQAQKVQFAASKLNDIYVVKHGIGDELMMHNEIMQLKQRLQDVEELVKLVIGISTKIDVIKDAVDVIELKTANVEQTSTSSYSQVLKATASASSFSNENDTGTNSGALHKEQNSSSFNMRQPMRKQSTETTERRVPFRTFTINPFARDPTVQKSSYQSTPTDEFEGWRTATRRKKRPAICVTGNMDSDTIQSSCVRPLKLFVTRCDVNATPERLQNELVGRNKWDIMNVESLKTRFDNYKSFKLVINRANAPAADFLRPECWPKGLMVREFKPPRRDSPYTRRASGVPNTST